MPIHHLFDPNNFRGSGVPLRIRFATWNTQTRNKVTKFKSFLAAHPIPDPIPEPMLTKRYLETRRDVVVATSKLRPLIRLANKNLDNVMLEVEGEIDASIEELSDDTGKLTINILYDNWIADFMIHQTAEIEDLHILVDPNPMKPDWRTRWGGKITEIHMKRDEQGIHTIQLVALSNREHAKRLMVAANPIFAPEIQLPKMWIMPGPTRTALSITMILNLARLFMPGLSIITNAFNPAGWFNPLGGKGDGLLPTQWPIQVAFCNTLHDQSRWTTVGGTWTDWHSTFKDILADSGCILRAYTYLTSDPDSPNHELAKILRDGPDRIAALTGKDPKKLDQSIVKMVAPTRNSIVFAVEQKDGRTGPTGNVFDGLLATVSVTLDDLITPVTVDLRTGKTYDPGQMLHGLPIEEATGVKRSYLFENLTDTAPAPPQVIWWQGTYSGPITTDLIFHKSSVKTVVTGGKSPSLLNEAQTFGIKYGLSEIQEVITGGEYAQTGPAPVGAGLDSLYQGQLDNTFFAWQRFTNPIRALKAGDLAYQEHFEKGTGTAYTLATVLTLRSGDWKTRPYAAYKADVLNGHPWIANQDYFLGDRVGFENDGIIYVDNVYSIKYEWSRQKPFKVTVGIGQDKLTGDPFGAAFRTMAAIWSLVGSFLGEGTIFG